MFFNLKKIIRFGWTGFSRNKGVSFSAIFVLLITLLLITGLYLFQGFNKFFIDQLQKKIDITAYFKDNTLEDDILKIKDEISKLKDQVKSVDYVSKEKALADFTEKHKNNPDFMKALEEVGGNPFLPSLNIQTIDPSQYKSISDLLNKDEFKSFIEKVDYYQKKPTIEKVFSITSNINKFGLILAGVLVLVAILVVFSTVKLTIDSSKEEISTMRMVGASNWFARGPFVVQGMAYGFFAFLLCIIITSFTTYFLSPKLEILLPGFSIFDYFNQNFWPLISIQLGIGVVLGMISSYFVARKYLKI